MLGIEMLNFFLKCNGITQIHCNIFIKAYLLDAEPCWMKVCSNASSILSQTSTI